jgi:cysteine desulfurase family protein (TIGR01976 family)
LDIIMSAALSPAPSFDVEACRRQFPGLLRQVARRPAIFCDGPGGSQVPQRVIDAVADCLANRNANEGGAFATSNEVGEILEAARAAAADLLGADDPHAIIFGPNMTTLTFALSRALARTWAPGDEVIVTRLDHDANVSPWTLAARDAGALVRYVDVNPVDCTLRLDQFTQLLGPRTRLVAVGVASNAVGTINPVRDMAAAAHGAGALVFLDAVHAAPHLPIDVGDLGCDFLACSAYKFFGPHLGILWGRRELLETLPAYKLRPASDALPGKWMTGTPSFEAIAGTMAAVEYMTSLGTRKTPADSRRNALVSAFASIRQHEKQLAAHFLEGIARLKHWRLWGLVDPARLDERVPTFSLTHEQRLAEELALELGRQGIFAWHGNYYALELVESLGLAAHGMLRIGFLHYNTMAEVDYVLEGLTAFG